MTRLAGALLALLLLAPPAHAILRSPQVPVSGTALATFFASQGQSIDVVGDQHNMQEFALASITPPAASVLIIHSLLGDGTLHLYNAYDPASPLFPIFPSGTPAGWYTIGGVQENTGDFVVRTFDDQDAFQGSVTHTGVAVFGVGCAVTGPSGTRYSQDARNPGGLARLLFYAGEGPLMGGVWLCAEHDADGTGDFADSVFLIEGMAVVPVRHTTWGAVKERFR